MNYVRYLTMIFAIVVFLFWITALSVSAQASQYPDIDTFMNELMETHMEESHIPNATISVVADGEIIYEQGFGQANIAHNIGVDSEETLFRIGSISKLFTWTAVMQLVEQGKLDLHTDVNEYIDFNIPDKIEYGYNGSQPKPITLQHLMTHTPGFEDYLDSIFSLSENDHLPLNEYVRDYLPKRVFPAGEMIAYSNYGTALAGYIVEQVSGMEFSDYVRKHIFTDLNMTRSTFQQPIPSELSPDMTEAYRYISGEYEQADFEFMPTPAGGMSSTAHDMAHFMITYLNGGSFADQRVLENETVEQMFTQQFTQHPLLNGMGLGFIEGQLNDKRTLFHGGSTMLFDAGLYLVPEEDLGIFIAYSGANHLVHKDISEAFMDQYFPNKKTTSPPIQASDAKERALDYVGEYQQNRKSFSTDEKIISLIMGTIQVAVDDEGYLTVTHPGETPQRFVEIEPGVYQNLKQESTENPFGGFHTIVFDEDTDVNIILATSGPMTYSQAPWYSATTFTFSALIIAIVSVILTVISWGVAALIRLITRRKVVRHKLMVATRLLVTIYGILTIGFIAGTAISGEIDPIYQLPGVVVPKWQPIIDIIPLFMTVIGIAIVCLTIMCWIKRIGKMSQRIHLSLFSIITILLIWIFSFWNLI